MNNNQQLEKDQPQEYNIKQDDFKLFHQFLQLILQVEDHIKLSSRLQQQQNDTNPNNPLSIQLDNGDFAEIDEKLAQFIQDTNQNYQLLLNNLHDNELIYKMSVIYQNIQFDDTNFSNNWLKIQNFCKIINILTFTKRESFENNLQYTQSIIKLYDYNPITKISFLRYINTEIFFNQDFETIQYKQNLINHLDIPEKYQTCNQKSIIDDQQENNAFQKQIFLEIIQCIIQAVQQDLFEEQKNNEILKQLILYFQSQKVVASTDQKIKENQLQLCLQIIQWFYQQNFWYDQANIDELCKEVIHFFSQLNDQNQITEHILHLFLQIVIHHSYMKHQDFLQVYIDCRIGTVRDLIDGIVEHNQQACVVVRYCLLLSNISIIGDKNYYLNFMSKQLKLVICEEQKQRINEIIQKYNNQIPNE